MTSAEATTGDALIRHDIAVGNILYGSVPLISLHLPEAWDIAPGVGRPEIIAAHERDGRKWIASGRAWYVLYHRQLGWAMELVLESGPQRKFRQDEGGETTEVHGHPAHVRRWQRRRGIFRPKTITFVEVTYNCEQSDRHIRVELSGRCPPEGFEEILGYVSHWECH